MFENLVATPLFYSLAIGAHEYYKKKLTAINMASNRCTGLSDHICAIWSVK
jgi:hypothetical protein